MSGPAAAGAAARKIGRARIELVLGQPFFGAMALRLALRPDPACPDMWTDGQTLGYNPAAVAAMSDAVVAGTMAHEILHLACEHHLRRQDREPGLWNQACDLAINGLLVAAGFTLPKGFRDDPQYTGKPAEAIYAALSRQRDQRLGGGGADKATAEAPPAAAAPGGGQGETPWAGQARKPEPAPPGTDMAGAARQRQAASGDAPSQTEALSDETAVSGEVRDHPDLSGDPSADTRRDLAARLRQDVSQSLRGSADMGDLPAGLVRLLGDLARPRLDWTALLRRFIMARAVNDYSWSPPNRRHVHMGLYLPSPRSQTLDDVVLAVDTSGSVDGPLLDAFCAELSAILDACDTRLVVYFCDAAVTETRVYTRHDPPLALSPRGGGGTDYRPAFARVEEEGLRPACLIYLTDLECDRFPATPPYPVLWVSQGEGRPAPPFGETLVLP